MLVIGFERLVIVPMDEPNPPDILYSFFCD
jgi:hypothetical protein